MHFILRKTKHDKGRKALCPLSTQLDAVAQRIDMPAIYPRPASGAFVAITVICKTFADNGRDAMYSTACAQSSHVNVGSSIRGTASCGRHGCGRCGKPSVAATSVAFPISSCPQPISYLRPSRDVAKVRPVSACLVAVYGALSGRGRWADTLPLLMIRPASCIHNFDCTSHFARRKTLNDQGGEMHLVCPERVSLLAPPIGVCAFIILIASWVHINVPLVQWTSGPNCEKWKPRRSDASSFSVAQIALTLDWYPQRFANLPAEYLPTSAHRHRILHC